VITSATSSMPEVGGQAALYCDPRREESIEEAIARLLGDESLRRSLGDAGLARAREFSWEITARRTVEVYSSLVRA
jgi:glycosyltransferase involved in cell wall biosynthesis